jgi:hypothetical protein
VAPGLDALPRLPLMFGMTGQPDEAPTGVAEALHQGAEGVRLLDERERVVWFRFDQLVLAGYDAGLATRLAEELSVDWHKAVDVLKAGCDARTAEAILL